MCNLSESSEGTAPWQSYCRDIGSVIILVNKVSAVGHAKPLCLHAAVCLIGSGIQRPLESEQKGFSTPFMLLVG